MNNKYILTIVGIIAIIFFALFLSRVSYTKPEVIIQSLTSPTQTSLSEREYISKDLEFSITIPEEHKIIDEGSSFLTLQRDGNDIDIDRISTNYLQLTDYIENLEEKNNLDIEILQSLNVNQLPSMIGIIKANLTNSSEKIYFIKADTYRIYTISTSSPEAYDDLDKVAQSFRYIPD